MDSRTYRMDYDDENIIIIFERWIGATNKQINSVYIYNNYPGIQFRYSSHYDLKVLDIDDPIVDTISRGVLNEIIQ